MGNGNWAPTTPARHHNADTFYNQIYVEIVDLSEDKHEDYIVEEAYDALKEVICQALPTSFSVPDDRQNSDWFGGGIRGRHPCPLLESPGACSMGYKRRDLAPGRRGCRKS